LATGACRSKTRYQQGDMLMRALKQRGISHKLLGAALREAGD
jgi:hypothetical protein